MKKNAVFVHPWCAACSSPACFACQCTLAVTLRHPCLPSPCCHHSFTSEGPGVTGRDRALHQAHTQVPHFPPCAACTRRFGGGKASASAAASAETVLYLNNTTPVMWTDGEVSWGLAGKRELDNRPCRAVSVQGRCDSVCRCGVAWRRLHMSCPHTPCLRCPLLLPPSTRPCRRLCVCAPSNQKSW